MEIIVSPTPVFEAARVLSETLQRYPNGPVLLLVSGGSWLAALDQLDTATVGPYVTIGLLDERYSTDVQVNNFAQLKETEFYRGASEAGTTFLDTRVQSEESFATFSERFERQLQDWRTNHPKGVILTTIGMGVDGHTAGIFPSLLARNQIPDTWAVGYQVLPNENEFIERVTVTPDFLKNQVTAAVALVMGQDKCVMLANVVDQTRPQPVPAQVWQDLKAVTIVTDCPVQNKIPSFAQARDCSSE